jgi:heterotetrameric sarcosine oxidase gamma subunit
MRRTRVSAPDPREGLTAPGVRLASLSADIVELAALRGRSGDLERLAAARGVTLPACGRIAVQPRGLALSVRPQRWLLLGAPATAGGARSWEEATAGCGTAVEHSSAFGAFVLEGPAVREMLKRSCRLDLSPQRFPEGCAAATILLQVSAILAALRGSMLLLTPATTARHVREWLVTTSQPFALVLAPEAGAAYFSGDDRA